MKTSIGLSVLFSCLVLAVAQEESTLYFECVYDAWNTVDDTLGIVIYTYIFEPAEYAAIEDSDSCFYRSADGRLYSYVHPQGKVYFEDITIDVYRKQYEPNPPLYFKTIKLQDKILSSMKGRDHFRLRVGRDVMRYWNEIDDWYYVTFSATFRAKLSGKTRWFRIKIDNLP